MRARTLSVWLAAVATFLCQAYAFAAPGDTKLVSVSHHLSERVSGNRASLDPSFSADGRFVAFASDASDLVSQDTNQREDIFVYDRQTAKVERVSVATGGAQANADSHTPSISADGRYVGFMSLASNLVPGDTNSFADVFVHDRQTGATTRASIGGGGVQGNADSGIGNANFLLGERPSLSQDGRYVAFRSDASNLVPNDTNGVTDVFVHDRSTGTTTRVNVSSSGMQADGFSAQPFISIDGRYVAFASIATNLGPDIASDTWNDVFVHDRQTGATLQVSVDSSGMPGDQASFFPSISADGSRVAFQSYATNLVPNDTNFAADIFVRDRQAGTTTRLSAPVSGARRDDVDAPFISSDGRYVVFSATALFFIDVQTEDGEFHNDLVRYDLQTGTRERTTISISQFSENAYGPVPSGNGRYTAFSSAASALVANDTNATFDIFVHDWQNASNSIVSVSKVRSRTADGASNTGLDRALSEDGRYVAFSSTAPNLVAGDTNGVADVFVRDMKTGATTRVSVGSDGAQGNERSWKPAISADGRFIAFESAASNFVAGDSSGSHNVFVHDRLTGTTTCIIDLNHLPVDGNNPSISADGRWVAFESGQVFVSDRQTGAITLVSISSSGAQADDGASQPAISGNGRYVAFSSFATNLVSGDTNSSIDVFVHDRQTGATTLVSAGLNGTPISSFAPSISADGRFVAFQSRLAGLVADDTNDANDVFVRDRQTGQTTRVSVDSSGAQTQPGGYQPSISGNGRYVAFESDAANLVAGDTNNSFDVFVHDRRTGETRRASVDANGVEGNANSMAPSISPNGRRVAFTSHSSNFIAQDLNEASDVFLHELPDSRERRINAGGAAFTDSAGRHWQADTGFNTGETIHRPVSIANTSDDLLYQDERWDEPPAPELFYAIAVPNGTYLVRLHFAENYAPNFGAGRRLFDVRMEGTRRIKDLDIFAAVGARAALIKNTVVEVTDGRLDLSFHHKVQNPLINAIELIPR